MKRIGLIGGLGPEATVEYYNLIINSFKDDKGELNYPEMIIYSVNMSEYINLMKQRRYDEAADKIIEKAECLERSGAEFAAITANTPHMLFGRISSRSPIPLVSIVEATCRVCQERGFRKVGLLGTGFTMNATFYPDVFSEKGIEVVMPDTDDKELINKKLFSEIELGIFKEETRNQLIGIIGKMAYEKKIDAIIQGCTELPLILKETEYAGIPSLNTTRIHVNAIVEYALS